MYLFICRENTIVFLADILCYNNATFMQSLLQLLIGIYFFLYIQNDIQDSVQKAQTQIIINTVVIYRK